MAQFKAFILLIVAIIILNLSFIMAQNSETQVDTIFLQYNEFNIIVNDKYNIDIEITQESKIKEIARIEKPIFSFHVDGKEYIAKGNEIFKSSVPENCDCFYVLDIQNKLILSDNKLSFIKVVYPEWSKVQQDQKILYIGKESISKIKMNRNHVTLTLDSNFMSLHGDEDILRYHNVKFDFYPENIIFLDCYAAILLPRMTASIQENKLESGLIWIRTWHLPRSDKNVVSFKRSIKKNFSKKMITYKE